MNLAMNIKKKKRNPFKKTIGFHVYRSEDKDLSFAFWKRLTLTPVLDNDFADRTIEPGKIYFYKLTDVDMWGIEGKPYEPPRGYFADEKGKEKIDHNPLNDVIGYQVYRSTKRDLPLDQWERRNEELLPTTGFEDKGIETGVTYYYYVTAVSAAGLESPPSEIMSVVGK